MTKLFYRKPFARNLAMAGLALAVAACSEQATPLAPGLYTLEPEASGLSVECEVTVATGEANCDIPVSAPAGTYAALIDAKVNFIQAKFTHRQYYPGTEIFQSDVTFQNVMPEAIGTLDGVTADPAGIRAILTKVRVTGGTGVITAANADGTTNVTGFTRSYWDLPPQMLAQNAISTPERIQLNVPTSVTSFKMRFVIETEHQYLLIINEVMANPNTADFSDGVSEWFEIYNAGVLPVQMEGLVIADSAASGRRPYHVVAQSIALGAGAYLVMGGSTDPTLNGGVPVDYSYGAAISLANSLDAIKIARVVGFDTITIDRTQYASPGVSAVAGISRELTNPALDNANMDGSNWASADVTAVYGSGGRGTPKALNSMFVP